MHFFRECLRFQLVGDLPEFVEISPRSEPEGMGYRPWCGQVSDRCGLSDAGSNCSIYCFLKGNAELPRSLFQQSRQIIVERQGRSHSDIFGAYKLMSRHQSVHLQATLRAAPE
jgi:hypothetical protein